MHLGDNTIPLAHAGIYSVLSGVAVAAGVRKYYKNSLNKLDYKIFSGMFTAFVFIVTIFEIPMPFGSSEHPTGTPLMAIFMGPLITPFLSMVVLLLELVFKEGAITTMGANVFSLGIVGGFVGWSTFTLLKKCRAGLFLCAFLAGFLGDLSVYLTTVIELTLGNMQGKTFMFYFLAFIPGQVPLALVEGLFTGLVIKYLYSRRPEMLAEFKVTS